MKNINILIREIWELYASETIYEWLKNHINSNRVQIQLILAAYNSDLKLLNISQIYEWKKWLIITWVEEHNKIWEDLVFWFNTDILWIYDWLVDYKLDIYELWSCKDPILIDDSSIKKKV